MILAPSLPYGQVYVCRVLADVGVISDEGQCGACTCFLASC